MVYEVTDELVDDLKKAVRVKSETADSEIRALAEAGVHDLAVAGAYAKDDALYRHALTLYVKANYGYDDGERFRKAYEALRNAMALSSDYEDGE